MSEYHIGGGGGGSGYIGGCITTSSASYTLSGSLGINSANGIPLPPATSDPSYVSGAGVGGQGNSVGGTPSAGGDGLVVITGLSNVFFPNQLLYFFPLIYFKKL